MITKIVIKQSPFDSNACIPNVKENSGCDGGEDFNAYNWIIKSGGLATEGAYPYLGQV